MSSGWPAGRDRVPIRTRVKVRLAVITPGGTSGSSHVRWHQSQSSEMGRRSGSPLGSLLGARRFRRRRGGYAYPYGYAEPQYRHVSQLSGRPRRACLGGAEKAGTVEPTARRRDCVASAASAAPTPAVVRPWSRKHARTLNRGLNPNARTLPIETANVTRDLGEHRAVVRCRDDPRSIRRRRRRGCRCSHRCRARRLVRPAQGRTTQANTTSQVVPALRQEPVTSRCRAASRSSCVS